MSVLIQAVKAFPVTVGEITLFLSAYEILGGCQLHEVGTADGSTAVASFWHKGSQFHLQGRLAGNPEHAIVALDTLARSRVGVPLQIGAVSCTNAVLIGYSIKENQEAIEISVTFYSSAPLVEVEQV